MNTWNLNGAWRLKYRKPGDEWSEIPAEVPGNVELDLMRAGVLPDLTRGNNVYRALEFEECEWLYETVFRLDALPAERLRLVFDGIDCFATIRLNGVEAGAGRQYADRARLRRDRTGRRRGEPPGSGDRSGGRGGTAAPAVAVGERLSGKLGVAAGAQSAAHVRLGHRAAARIGGDLARRPPRNRPGNRIPRHLLGHAGSGPGFVPRQSAAGVGPDSRLRRVAKIPPLHPALP